MSPRVRSPRYRTEPETVVNSTHIAEDAVFLYNDLCRGGVWLFLIDEVWQLA